MCVLKYGGCDMILIFALIVFLHKVVEYQVEYRLHEMTNLRHFIALLVVTCCSTVLVAMFIVTEKDTDIYRALLTAMVCSVSLDIARDVYPGSGCIMYIVSLLFFSASQDVYNNTAYLCGSVSVTVISLAVFATSYTP